MTAEFPKSRRSGGPKTAEGKAVSSRNSIKTGAYSKQEVLPGENLQELLELEQYFIEDFSPQGVTESAFNSVSMEKITPRAFGVSTSSKYIKSAA